MTPSISLPSFSLTFFLAEVNLDQFLQSVVAESQRDFFKKYLAAKLNAFEGSQASGFDCLENVRTFLKSDVILQCLTEPFPV